jgi:hypothetical protein
MLPEDGLSAIGTKRTLVVDFAEYHAGRVLKFWAWNNRQNFGWK